ncbi:MAG: TAXI family TRAP transporter solute-binding subunit [Planctomycetaceae bacterium]|nr:TAXI family TRAP transporter solute-binding subunit [Planctomycetaceae bacterium]
MTTLKVVRFSFADSLLLWAAGLLACVSLFSVGCGGTSGDGTASTGKRLFISVGTAPAGAVFNSVGSAICEVVNENRGDLNWTANAEATGGSMENIRLLSQDKLQFAMSNASITYFAVRGTEGWEQKHDVQSVISLFPNIAMFVTLANSGIQNIADLKGKRVYIGPEGAGFEYFIKPILEAHGLKLSDLEVRYGTQQEATEMLSDGTVVAAMLGGGTPNPAITQVAQGNAIRFLPYEESAKQKLLEQYPFFTAATIPAGTYNGIDGEFAGLSVGWAHLIVHQSQDEETVYQLTKLLWENREKIATRNRAAAGIKPETAAQTTGVPYHAGAEKYFREIGIWPEASTK